MTSKSSSSTHDLLSRPILDLVPLGAFKQASLIVFLLAVSGGLWQFVDIRAEKLGWIAADATVFVQFLRRPGEFIDLCRRAPIFALWPLLACLSATWSPDFGFTLYQGVQLWLTVFASFLICIEMRLQKVIEAVFVAMTIAAVIVFVTCVLRPDLGIDDANCWRGGFTTKNVMGDAMVLLVISAACLILCRRWMLIAAASMCLGLFLILMSRSATPLLSLILTLAPIPIMAAYILGRRKFMATTGIGLILASVAAAIIFIAREYANVNLIDDVLAMVGKERTLTGRTVLWALADEAIRHNPWYGMGFKGYWVNPPAGMLEVRKAFGADLFFFHNNYLEVAVAYGIMGSAALIIGIASAFWLSLVRLLRQPSMLSIWPLLIVIQVLIQTFVQYPLMVNHSPWQVIFVVAALVRI